MSRVSSCGSGSLVTLLATSCQLVPNPALLGGEASTGVDAASSSSSAGMDGVGTTGPADTSTTGPADSSTSGPADASTTGPADSSTTGPAEELWCMDVDADGFGDPAACMQAGTMPAGTVNNDDDCDDGSPDTFPGAAPNDDPLACMNDADDDDWGDDTPLAGVDPGTDCDDGNDSTFPGAAENEMVPDLCMQDEDGDGWGDASPDIAGPVAGSDCHDTNPDLNPDTLQLTVLTPYNGSPGASRMLQTVDPTTAALAPFVTLQDPLGNIPNINVSSATMDANGMILANDLNGAELYTVDYMATCGPGMVTGLGSYDMSGSTILFGLEFASDGTLYGVGNDDMLHVFDPGTGQEIDTIELTLGGNPFDANGGGMAYDCAQDRLLFANGSNWSIYSIDPSTGGLTVNRGTFGPQPVSNLAYLPICSP